MCVVSFLKGIYGVLTVDPVAFFFFLLLSFCVLSVVLLVLVCILLIFRVCTVIWRNIRRPLHSPGSARLMISPLDGSKFTVFT